MPTNIILASNNQHKVTEIQKFFTASNYRLLSQADFKIPEVAENGLSFIANALLKLYHVAKQVDLPVIADDSGLEIDALNGAPGIYSARYAGLNATAAENIARVLMQLKNIPEYQRNARFRCVIAYLENKNAVPKIFTGIWEGRITFAPAGENGFGYDPIFFVPTHNCVVAELSSDVKNSISHRAQALHKLAFYLTK